MTQKSNFTWDDEARLVNKLITLPNVFEILFLSIEKLQLLGQYKDLNRLLNVIVDHYDVVGLSKFEVCELFLMLHDEDLAYHQIINNYRNK